MVTALGENSHLTEGGANIYLKILLAIDSEVVDRTIDQTNEVSNIVYFLTCEVMVEKQVFTRPFHAIFHVDQGMLSSSL